MLKQRSNKKFHLKDGDVDGGGVQQLLLQLEMKQLAALSVLVPVILVVLLIPVFSIGVSTFSGSTSISITSVSNVNISASTSSFSNILTCSLKWKDWLYCQYNCQYFYRTQLSLGSDLWVLMSLSPSVQDYVQT